MFPADRLGAWGDCGAIVQQLLSNSPNPRPMMTGFSASMAERFPKPELKTLEKTIRPQECCSGRE
jgi:hypothetical protein